MRSEVAAHEQEWHPVGTTADVAKRKRVVISIDDRQILVVAHEGAFYAFDNICIHRDRELSKGVILNGKLVCPGPQQSKRSHQKKKNLRKLLNQASLQTAQARR